MGREDEPKPLMSLYKMLLVCQETGNMRQLSQQALSATIKVLTDSSQVDIGNMTARMRVQFVNTLSQISKQRNSTEVEDLTLQFIDSIQEDITSLDERSVVELMNSLNNVISNDNTSANLRRVSSKLQQTVHQVVS